MQHLWSWMSKVKQWWICLLCMMLIGNRQFEIFSGWHFISSTDIYTTAVLLMYPLPWNICTEVLVGSHQLLWPTIWTILIIQWKWLWLWHVANNSLLLKMKVLLMIWEFLELFTFFMLKCYIISEVIHYSLNHLLHSLRNDVYDTVPI